ncbi:hypothetical protein GCM10027168_35070 [Streptomyces capparidis]
MTFRGVAEAARRAPLPGGPPPPDDADVRHAPWWRVRALRRAALRGGLSVGGLLVFGCVAVHALPWWGDAVRLTAADTARARAVVRDVDGALLPGVFPDNVEVVFTTAQGRRVRALVAHGGEAPEPGAALEVEYAVSAPSHAAPVGDGGLLWGAGASAVAAGLALARVGRRAADGGRRTRALVRAARSPEAHPARCVLLRDTGGGPDWLLLFPVPGGREDAPSHLLPVRAVGVDPVGLADPRGEVRDGGDVVPWVDGRAVWPEAPLAVFGAEHVPLVERLTAPASAG